MENKNKKMGIGFGVMILRRGDGKKGGQSESERVLLGQRHSDPLKADSAMHGEGTWTMPGGKLHFGESFEEGATREVLEETGIKINPKNLTVISLTNDIVPDAHFVTVGMLYSKKTTEPKVMEPNEITQWQWFPISNLPTPLFPPSKKIMGNYLNNTVYKNP